MPGSGECGADMAGDVGGEGAMRSGNGLGAHAWLSWESAIESRLVGRRAEMFSACSRYEERLDERVLGVIGRKMRVSGVLERDSMVPARCHRTVLPVLSEVE